VLGTNEYVRLRIGIGDGFSKGMQVDYVLGQWTEEERKTLDSRIDTATETIKSFVTLGPALTMTHFNNK
jgi:PTH1 family peptidyl-tRNA hydrolase